MLRAAEADALSTEADGALGIAWVVGVGPNPQAAYRVGPPQQRPQILLLGEVGLHGLDGALVDGAGRAVNRDLVALAHDLAGAPYLEDPLLVVHADRLAA